jgi:hypothetical protein
MKCLLIAGCYVGRECGIYTCEVITAHRPACMQIEMLRDQIINISLSPYQKEEGRKTSDATFAKLAILYSLR